MKLKEKIKGDRLYLRSLTLKDATKKYCSWLNNEEVNKYLETKSVTIDELKEYISEKNKSKGCLFFGIFLNDKNHIGNVKLEPIDFEKKTANFSIMIGDKEYWNQGYGTEVIKLIIDYAFNTLKLEFITLGVKANHKVAIKLYEKIGFKINEYNMILDKQRIRQGAYHLVEDS